ncbi:hypothetical protein B1R32_11110 [Abditibacterium utsteinense]|uniref:Uncharacterized protein n=1 Tax=Abditibacterium utsteinense TaxID=1960156 RepID=A0A2S8SRS2_9BACT|nr:hypothetical protein [Abditibacterium utsteinense]PQV63449.1 hypothetical protein B1R32_11110 [Abditibacterium utsteinense]
MNAFVTIKSDLETLSRDIISQSKTKSVVFDCLDEFDEAKLATLQQADAIYLVISENSMCSTAYQNLLIATIPYVEIKEMLSLEDG